MKVCLCGPSPLLAGAQHKGPECHFKSYLSGLTIICASVVCAAYSACDTLGNPGEGREAAVQADETLPQSPQASMAAQFGWLCTRATVQQNQRLTSLHIAGTSGGLDVLLKEVRDALRGLQHQQQRHGRKGFSDVSNTAATLVLKHLGFAETVGWELGPSREDLQGETAGVAGVVAVNVSLSLGC